MKTNLLLLFVFIMNIGMAQEIECETFATSQESNSLIHNNKRVYDTYMGFRADLRNKGVILAQDIFGLKYLLVEEGLENGPELAKHNLESKSDRSKGYILISPTVVADDAKLKATLYKELTEFLRLNISDSDTKILKERNTTYDYTQITDEDYDELFNLIKSKLGEKYIQVFIPVEG